eukprot:TRINITY_DN9864_c0_g1_i1.p1 TRINITY_DN9864_c0_g1~~TRINITY_DN9864_c0_g1_i1.p1  ORF type:complete len:1336 (-),score=421.23 TRINITY_DN9864_c0_g1_i1:62-3634(-)
MIDGLIKNQGRVYIEGQNFVLINGYLVEPDKIQPLELLDLIKSEISKGESLVDLGLSATQTLNILKSWKVKSGQAEESTRFKINSDSIIYLNDIESEKRYAAFPSNINVLMRPPARGQFKYVRKNAVTVLLFLDASETRSIELLSVINHYLSRFLPIRVGVVFGCPTVSDLHEAESVDACKLVIKSARYLASIPSSNPSATSLTSSFFSQLSQFESIEGFSPHEVESALIETYPDADLDSVHNDESLEDLLTSSDEYLRSMGFVDLSGIPIGFVNGIPVTLGEDFFDADDIGQSFLENIAPIIMQDYEQLATLTQKGAITLESDIYQVLRELPSTLPVFHRLIAAEDEANTEGSLVSTQLDSAFGIISTANLSFISNPQREDDIIPISHFVVVDLDTFEGQSLALDAVLSMNDADVAHPWRIALVHNPISEDSVSSVTKRAILAAIHTQSGSRVYPFILALYDREESELSDEVVIDLARSSGFNLESFSAIFASPDALHNLLDLHHSIASHLKIDLYKQAIVTNGKIIKVQSGSEKNFSSDFFRILSQYEYNKKVQPIYSLFDAKAHTSQHLSDVIAKVSARLLSLPMGNLRRLALEEHIPSAFSLRAEHPLVSIQFVVNPLSRAAQRFTPILMGLRENGLPIDISVYLNPLTSLSDLPIKSFYNYVFGPIQFDANGREVKRKSVFENLPLRTMMTMGVDVRTEWLVEPVESIYDLDNIRLEDVVDGNDLVAKFKLQNILVQGSCSDAISAEAPRGLQLILSNSISPDSVQPQDTLVMANFGYFQLKANPGLWKLQLASGRGRAIYDITSGSSVSVNHKSEQSRPRTGLYARVENLPILVHSFDGAFVNLMVQKKRGMEKQHLLFADDGENREKGGMWNSFSGLWNKNDKKDSEDDDTIHVFSVASGRLYERFLKIMILSVLKNTRSKVKFWFLKNFLSPDFKDSIPTMADKYNFTYELVTYQWPTWLNAQTEKQRIIWGYKILFLDVLFPLNVSKIIYVDSDDIVRADIKELWDLELQDGASLGYPPMGNSNPDTEGFRFWKQGFWKNHLMGKTYHISALYVVDLVRFRQLAAGDQMRSTYQMLSQDPNSLANLDQDLPNYLQHYVKIHSLPQDWLWCETWCDQESKSTAKVIDLCNNPLTKTPKLNNALRIIEEWSDFDQEIKRLQTPSTSAQDDHQDGEKISNMDLI